MPIDPNKLITLPMVRKAMPSAIASQIAGVQPMGETKYDQYLEMAISLVYQFLKDHKSFENVRIELGDIIMAETIYTESLNQNITINLYRDDYNKIRMGMTYRSMFNSDIIKEVENIIDYVNKIDAI